MLSTVTFKETIVSLIIIFVNLCYLGLVQRRLRKVKDSKASYFFLSDSSGHETNAQIESNSNA